MYLSQLNWIVGNQGFLLMGTRIIFIVGFLFLFYGFVLQICFCFVLFLYCSATPSPKYVQGLLLLWALTSGFGRARGNRNKTQSGIKPRQGKYHTCCTVSLTLVILLKKIFFFPFKLQQ